MENKNEINLLPKDYQYSNLDIEKIIETKEGTTFQNSVDNINIDAKKANKFYSTIAPGANLGDPGKDSTGKDAYEFANAHIQKWKENSKNPRCTFVFPVHMSGNHWATFAFNTEGEILCVNSLGGFDSWNKTVIENIEQALKDNDIPLKNTIKITPDENKQFKQKDIFICGAITAEICLAISPDTSFIKQKETLEKRLASLCASNYEDLHQQHHPLIEAGTGPSIKVESEKESNKLFSKEDTLIIQDFFKDKADYSYKRHATQNGYAVYKKDSTNKEEKAFDLHPTQVILPKKENDAQTYTLAIALFSLLNPGKTITIENVRTDNEKNKIVACLRELNALRKEGEKITFAFAEKPLKDEKSHVSSNVDDNGKSITETKRNQLKEIKNDGDADDNVINNTKNNLK